jgi:hypothetical protein
VQIFFCNECRRRISGVLVETDGGKTKSDVAVLCSECRAKAKSESTVSSSRRVKQKDMKLDKQVIPIAALVVFTCLVVTLAIASLGRSKTPEEHPKAATPTDHFSSPPSSHLRAEAEKAAQHSAPAANAEIQKAPAVAESRPPEPAIPPQTPAPGSPLTRPEQAVTDAKPIASTPVPETTPPEKKEEKKESKVEAIVAQPNAAAPAVADDTDGPAPVTTGKEIVWIDDALPPGARAIKESNNEEWAWVKQDPAPFSGTLAHQSAIQTGVHQHAFRDANPALKVEAGDVLTAYVFIDSAHPPAEIMLQWHAGEGYFNHRAYWGANKIEWGSDNSPTRHNMGPLPPPGQWVLLQVPAAQVGLEGQNVTGISFTLFDGRATWDRIGKIPKGGTTEAPVRPAAAAAEPKTKAPAVVQNPKEEYEKTLAAAYAKLSPDTVERTILDLEKVQSDPQYAEVGEIVGADLECVRGYKEFLNAASKSLPLIGAQRSFKLKTVDGKETIISSEKHCAVKEVKDGALWIEEEMGGASATRKIAFEQLSAQTLYELAVLSLPSGAASDLKLGFAGYIAQLNNGTIPVPELRTRLESAGKDASSAKAAGRVLDRLNTAINDRAMNAAMKRIESAIKGKDFASGKSLLNDFKRNFGATATPTISDFIQKAAFEMSDLKPGLWASYYCGDETNPARKYLFSREETKLYFNWGRGSPDPRVPNEFFTIRFNGLLRVKTTATYTFTASADDLLEMSIDNKKVLNVSWHADGEAGKNCAVKLNAGDHELRIVFKQYLVDASMNVRWKLDNESKWQEIPESMLWHDPRLVEKYQKDAF